MARPLRILYTDAFYHVTARGNEKRPIFKNEKDRERFLLYAEAAVERYGAVIHAYCLLDNHYHLLIQTPLANLSEIMQYINGSYTTYVNIKRQGVGHLFQGRYKAILIDADAYAQELSRYMHLNPVRAGMVDKPGDYQWSSYPYYSGKKSAPEWLTMDFILGYFDERTKVGQRKYVKFVEAMIGQRYESPLKAAVASSILGDEDFINRIKAKYLRDRDTDRNLPGLTELRKRTVKEIMKEVESVLKGNERLKRVAGIYLSHRYSELGLREIGGYFGIGESAVSQSSRRFGIELEKDKKLNNRMKDILSRLGFV